MEEPMSDDRCNVVTRELPDDGDTITAERSVDATTSTQAVQHVRTTIPVSWGIALDHATADLRITKTEAVREGVGMFLRFHGFGRGVPEPLPPMGRQ